MIYTLDVLNSIGRAIARKLANETTAEGKYAKSGSSYYINPMNWYSHKSGTFAGNRRKQMKKARKKR